MGEGALTPGHLQVAAAIAAGPADARSELVIPAGQFASREVRGLLEILSSAWLADQLANMPGYDPA